MIRVLHVYRGYGDKLKNPVIDNQIYSLDLDKIQSLRFILKKGGFYYVLNIFKLRKFVKVNNIDIIHAHYSFSGLLSSLSFSGKPIVCSLMGSDVLANKLFNRIIKFFNKKMWTRTIVKSIEMKKVFPNTVVIPNGVDFKNFRPINKSDAIFKTGFNKDEINIIFVATNPNTKVKNINLAKTAVEIVKEKIEKKVNLHILSNVKFLDLPYFFSSADMLLLTSFSEGSPNVIKEAMACNCPIVSTNVGDIADIITEAKGCFITNFNSEDVALKIVKAIKFGTKTNGRKLVGDFSTDKISKKIYNLYINNLT